MYVVAISGVGQTVNDYHVSLVWSLFSIYIINLDGGINDQCPQIRDNQSNQFTSSRV